MLDINLLRRDLPHVLERLNARKSPQTFLDVGTFQAMEGERKTLQTHTEELQARRNSLSKQIGQRKSKGESVDDIMAEVASIKDDLEQSAQRLELLQADMQALLQALPNLPHPSVPVGSDEHGNVELRRWSPSGTEPAALGFAAKDHVDVGEPLGLDFDMGVKLTGARFSVMQGPMARLHRALVARQTACPRYGANSCRRETRRHSWSFAGAKRHSRRKERDAVRILFVGEPRIT